MKISSPTGSGTQMERLARQFESSSRSFHSRSTCTLFLSSIGWLVHSPRRNQQHAPCITLPTNFTSIPSGTLKLLACWLTRTNLDRASIKKKFESIVSLVFLPSFQLPASPHFGIWRCTLLPAISTLSVDNKLAPLQLLLLDRRSALSPPEAPTHHHRSYYRRNPNRHTKSDSQRFVYPRSMLARLVYHRGVLYLRKVT